MVCRGLVFKLSPVVHGINAGRLNLKIAGDLPGQGAIIMDCRGICLIILPRFFQACAPYQICVNKAMLSGDFSRGVHGYAAADRFGLSHNATRAQLFQFVRGKYTAHAAANNKHIGFYIARKRRADLPFNSFAPQRAHL
jgi:hypothetical protein